MDVVAIRFIVEVQLMECSDSTEKRGRQNMLLLVLSCAYTCTDYSGSDDHVGQEAKWT